jgi:hypothetical protein
MPKAQNQLLGGENSDTLAANHKVAKCLIGEKKYAEAEEKLSPLVEERKRVLSASSPVLLDTVQDLFECLVYLDREDEADKILSNFQALRVTVL